MYYFRVDSNRIISSGHIMRCISIATALIESNEQVCFLIADSNPIPILKKANIPYLVLESDWQDLMTDVKKVEKIINEDKNPTVIIDTYRVTKQYIEALKPLCKIAYLGSKPDYLGELDCIINYSTDIDYEFYNKNYGTHTKLLLGAEYAPLRKEFQNNDLRYISKVERILLSTGNTDNENIVSEILFSLLSVIETNSIVIDVVVGRLFEHKNILYETFDSNPRIQLHDTVNSMSSLMKKCDLAISANGTTVYELSAMGVPIVSFALVNEQVKSAEMLSKLGVIDYCGCSFNNKCECIKQITKRVKYYTEHIENLNTLANKAHQLIDGNGSQRILAALLQ